MLKANLTVMTKHFVLAAAAIQLYSQHPANADGFIDPTLAMKQFKAPAGFKVDLWAAEPQLKNPVALCVDEHGRVYVAETYRLVDAGVFDIRGHMNLYTEDLACRTVEDRAAMITRNYPGKLNEFTNASEAVRLLEDKGGVGHADTSTVFADGFNRLTDGVGASVLARKGNVYFTDIPSLWLLRDTNHDGVADVRRELSYGYGVHFGYSGHDLHGLRIGPDGRLYFSMGDRGISVHTKEGKFINYPDMGGVLRCDLDGSNLEIFATGLRNPQKLAFDDYGNLFTGDNNCDNGDAARLVYVVEGGDCGWRIANQFSETTPAGTWNSEKLWHLHFPGQAAYIIPPVGLIADGPSGITHYPGTGLPESYNNHLFLCDFRGASVSSGIHSFVMETDGAGFKLEDRSHFLWSILATDAEFGPDGRMYVTDWVEGWEHKNQGRIYRAYDPNLVNSPLVLETKKLIADGMEKRPLKELGKLLAHRDQRVRQEAQFELADRGAKSIDTLAGVAAHDANQLARLHAIWAIGQIGRASLGDSRMAAGKLLRVLLPLLKDKDAEVRAQTAKVVGEDLHAGGKELIPLLADANSRVRFFAAISLGNLRYREAVAPLLEMLRQNDEKDPFLRHAGVMGLLGAADKAALVAAAGDKSAAVRMAVVVVMRRKQMPEVASFLHDSDPLIVVEAARAINDANIVDAMPQLAALTQQPTSDAMLDWRAVNSAFRVGTPDCAAQLARYASGGSGPPKARAEAFHALETWADPSPRDRITGLWQPLPKRDGKPAVEALRPVIARVINDSPNEVRVAAIHAAAKLSLGESSEALATIVGDTKLPSKTRVEALKALGELHDARLADAVKIAVADSDEKLRTEGNRLQAEIKPGDATAQIEKILETGSVTEKQGALATLNDLEGDAPDKILAVWLDKLIAGKVPKEIQLDLIEAAEKRQSESVKTKLKQYEDSRPKDDEFLGFRETLYGGDAAAGRKIFTERQDASCMRCHKVNGQGGEVGPELTGIITRHDRNYILESIILPNKQIAPGYESVLIQTNDGEVYSGIVKKQDDKELTLINPADATLTTIKKSDIKSQNKGISAMPENLKDLLSKQDIRNLVEFLATVK